VYEVSSRIETVADRVSNPFGMRVPRLVESDPGAVYGYGDVGADFHVIGDYPGRHGGAETGVPFTGSDAGRRLQRVLGAVDLAADEYADRPSLENCFLSYCHPAITPGSRAPTAAEYREAEPFLDAELRAINAHVLLPVGERAIQYVLREHTTQAENVEQDPHAVQVRGRGFLVVPVRDPAVWDDDDEAALVTEVQTVLGMDYRQTKGVPTLVG
jgi:uracil-DNA glycosylase family 4